MSEIQWETPKVTVEKIPDPAYKKHGIGIIKKIFNFIKYKNFKIHNNVLIRYKGDKETVIIPDGITHIGNGTFNGVHYLTDVHLPDTLLSIGEYAFYECENLTNIRFPDTLTSIGHSAFAGCKKLTNIQFPNSLTDIAERAFFACDSLTTVYLPRFTTCRGLGYFYTFFGCDNLKEIKRI